ncbi:MULTISPECIES: MarR family winged helix-turn-helix transcriptional regulator [Polymorphospora]|uniref:MarR family winged helix-turn-helix transcriptional regulator n=1 Tax=Polymorphospora lycopeni TaxID=3140240 RepID=A0ABV5CPF6_9ACTN
MSDWDPADDVGTAHLGRLLLRALRQVQANAVARLHARGHPGIRTGHLPVFGYIDDAGTRITDLAARADMTRQMMGRLVRELEELGYVTTRTDPDDQRAVVVTLTAQGYGFGADGEAVKASLEREYEELLGPGEPARLRRSLALLANLGSGERADG